MSRPVKIDLIGKTFGQLEVIARRTEHPPTWECVCRCGNLETKVFGTAQLRWNHKRDCGCGTGRAASSNSEGGPKGYKFATVLGDLIHDKVRAELGPARDRRCTLCGLSPARYLMPAYGIQDPRFRLLHNDVRAYVTLCGICRNAAKLMKYSSSITAIADQWFSLASQILPNGDLSDSDLRGLAELLIEHQTPEEACSPAGLAALKAAKSLL